MAAIAPAAIAAGSGEGDVGNDPLAQALLKYITTGPRATDTTAEQVQTIIKATTAEPSGRQYLESILNIPVLVSYPWSNHAEGVGEISLGIVGTTYNISFRNAQLSCDGESSFAQKLAGPFTGMRFTLYFNDANMLQGTFDTALGTFQGGSWVVEVMASSAPGQGQKPLARIVLRSPPFNAQYSNIGTVTFKRG